MKNAADVSAARHLACIASLMLLAAVTYSNSIEVPFTFDDRHNITENHRIRARRLGPTELCDAAFESPTKTRPLANASFALNYRFGRYDVSGYHLVNIAVHAVGGAFVYLFVVVTLGCAGRIERRVRSSRVWIALFTSVLFTVHPIQTQAVTYIVQRMTGMAAMFYLAAMLLYIAGRRVRAGRRRWVLWSAGVVCWVAALGSKEIAVTLPLSVLLYELYFFADSRRTHAIRRCGYGLMALVIAALPVWLFMNDHVLDFSIRDFDLGQRVLTQFRVLIFYTSLLLFPNPGRLNLMHHIATSRSVMDPPVTIVAIIALLGIVVLALTLVRKDRLVSFGIVWFLIHLFLESSILRLEMIFEHRLYLPMVGACVVAVILLYRVLAFDRSRVTFVAIGVLLLLAMATFQRNRIWRDPVLLWSDVIGKNPYSARAHVDIGVTFAGQGRSERAIREYREAIRLDSDSKIAHNNLGNALLLLGRLDDAALHLEKAIQIDSAYAVAITNLGNVLRTRGDVDEAIAHYRRSLTIDPDIAKTHSNLGIALRSKGKVEEAIGHYRRALALDPDFDDAHYNLGNALQSQGKLDDAIRHYRMALRLRPEFPEACNNLAASLLTKGSVDEAVGHLRQVLVLTPDDIEAHTNLGHALELQGKRTEAADHFRRAISINPNKAMGHSGLAAYYDGRGRLTDALHHLSRAVAIAPDNAEARFDFAFALHRSGRIEEAIDSYREAIRLRPQWPRPRTHLAWILATNPDAGIRKPQEAIEQSLLASDLLAGPDAVTLDTLAAAYAAVKRYGEAVATAKRAYDLAVAAGNDALAEGITQRVRLYKRRLPYRDLTPTQ